MTEHVTRLAPSPTGALHLGNARTFLVNWLLARKRGWRVLMRVEDLDGPRVKGEAADQMLQELRWLGLQWQEPIVRQSQRGAAYQAALDHLTQAGQAYPCVCSRADIAMAASAPHGEDAWAAYPGTCRDRFGSAAEAAGASGRPVAWRLRVGEAPVTVHDEFAGPRQFKLAETCGDFVIFKNDGVAAYQLAVVVDDAAGGVDAIVRGDDLLESAARQSHLRRLLGLSPEPKHWHLPLVVGPDGRRLAKRHGDTRLARYRRAGTSRQRLLGLLGHWCGLIDRRRECTMEELLDRFDLARLPRQAITFTRQDDEFLLGGAGAKSS